MKDDALVWIGQNGWLSIEVLLTLDGRHSMDANSTTPGVLVKVPETAMDATLVLFDTRCMSAKTRFHTRILLKMSSYFRTADPVDYVSSPSVGSHRVVCRMALV